MGPGKVRSSRHVALLARATTFESLHRREDLVAEGVDSVFGVRKGEADLQALYFKPQRFTPAQARRWLDDLGLRPILFLEAVCVDRQGGVIRTENN
jgi:hypothetical protein